MQTKHTLLLLLIPLLLPLLFLLILWIYPSPSVDTLSEEILIPSSINLTLPDAAALENLSRARIEFSHGPACNQTVHPSVSKLQAQTLSRYNALAVDSNANGKILYLTFDCGYEYQGRTRSILDLLKEKQIPAAFFLVQDFAELEPELTQRIIEEGHIIGNHSASHKDFTAISDEELLEEVASFHHYMEDTFHYTPVCFRFPSGIYSEYSLALIASFGYHTYFWSCAYADWDTEAGLGAEAALEVMKDRLHSGAVIMLHPVSADEPALLEQLIEYAQEQGYIFRKLPWA